LIQAIVSEDNAIKALRVRNSELIKQRDLISTSTDVGRARIEKLNTEINKNNDIITKNTSVLEKQKGNVGNYTTSIKEAIANSGQFGQATVGLSDDLIKLVNPITGAIAAGAALFKMYVSSTTGARDLARAQDTLSTAFNIASESVGDFINKITGGGDGPGPLELAVDAILFRISPATAALSKLAADAKDRLRDLEISAKFAQEFAKDDERKAELQRRVRDDEEKTLQQRITAANQINSILETSAQRTVTVLQAQIEAIKESTINYNNNREAQLRVAEIEAEIADKREEITGKLTENVTALATLRTQFDDEQELRTRRQIDTDNELMSVREFNFQRENELLIQSEINTKESIDRVASIRTTQRAKDDAAENKQLLERQARIKHLEESELSSATAVTNGLANLLKKESAAQRSFTLLTIALNTAVGIANAVKAGSGVPWPANIAAILSGIAVVLSGIAQAKSAISGYIKGGLVKAWDSVKGFAGGGLSGTKIRPEHGTPINRSNGDNRLVTVKTNEVILNERQQAALGGDETFRRIGVPGYAGGGITGATETRNASRIANQSTDIRQLVQEVNKVKTILVLQDFEAAAAAKDEPANRAIVI
jgi:hypothetical protein